MTATRRLSSTAVGAAVGSWLAACHPSAEPAGPAGPAAATVPPAATAPGAQAMPEQGAQEMPEQGTFTGDGVSLFYRLVGDGPDTLVVIHGGPGMDMGYMVPDFAPLARHHRLLFYDQRGGGRSELPADDPELVSIDRHVADLEALRRHFGLDRMTLVAHSFGPALAARYAMAHPDRVARMVFLGPVPPRRGDMWQRYTASMEAALTADQRRRLGELEEAMATGPDPVAACREYWAIAVVPRVARPELAARVTGDFCGASADAIRYGMAKTNPRTMASLGDWDFRAGLAAVAAPTLIVHGEADAIPMDLVREWITALPDARLLELSGAGHFPYVERPDIVWPMIEAFLVGHAAGGHGGDAGDAQP